MKSGEASGASPQTRVETTAIRVVLGLAAAFVLVHVLQVLGLTFTPYAWQRYQPPSSPYVIITRAYVISSYWSAERADFGKRVCDKLEAQGISCVVQPGIYLKPFSPEQLKAFVTQQPITSRVTHGSLLEWFAWALGHDHRAQLVYSPPDQIHPGAIGNTLSAVNILRNWTSGTLQPSNLSPESQILVVEDDVIIPDNFREVLASFKLNTHWGLINLYNTPYACNGVESVRPSAIGATPDPGGVKLVRPRFGFSRTTAVIYSYRGALSIVNSLPFAEIIDMFYRRLIRRGVLEAYVACPNVVPVNESTPSVREQMEGKGTKSAPVPGKEQQHSKLKQASQEEAEAEEDWEREPEEEEEEEGLGRGR